MQGLKPGGFFILQNFSLDQPSTNRFGPKNAEWLVAPTNFPALLLAGAFGTTEDVTVELDEGMHKGRGAVVRLLVEKVGVE